MKLLLTLSLMVSAYQEAAPDSCPSLSTRGSCLLAKKKVIGKVSLIQEESLTAFEELGLQQRDWRIRHQSQEKAMNASQTLLDRFITAQAHSSDSCSSRLMESKRILDGILADVRNLNAQVMSHEEVLETETENLKITKMSIDAVNTEYKTSVDYCEELVHEALQDFKKYSKEQEELDSIANPSMRMEISHSVKIKSPAPAPAADAPDRDNDPDSLIQVKLDKKMCEAFVDFTRRHAHHKVLDDRAPDCDKQREELQEAFEKAYKEIRELKEDAKQRSEDKTCFETALAKKSAELVPLVSQRDIAIEKIEVASQAIAAITPVLNLVKEKAEKLRTHISETLTPECTEAGDVSKVLVEVRKLIISLEECPGRNDFKLKIPAEEEPTEAPEEEAVTDAEAPTAAPEAPEEEPTEAPKEEPEEPAEEPTEAPEPEVPEDDKPPAGAEEPEVPEDDKPPAGAEENEVPEDDKPPPGAETAA